jgi:hypothetical protein
LDFCGIFADFFVFNGNFAESLEFFGFLCFFLQIYLAVLNLLGFFQILPEVLNFIRNLSILLESFVFWDFTLGFIFRNFTWDFVRGF